MSIQLTAEAEALLPNLDETVRCSEFSKTIGLAPQGTAIRADLVVLVPLSLPWPKPALAHPELDGLLGTYESASGPTRLFTYLPVAGQERTVRVFWRDAERTRTATLQLSAEESIAEQLAPLLADAPLDAGFVEDTRIDAVLICTQGSHDVCCGTEGTRLAAAFELTHPHIDTYRVSHTGGHRFAPTAMTFPSGRMWADLELKDLTAIVNQTGSPADVAELCRGWWGAAMGPAQVAEVAVFAQQNWHWEKTDRYAEAIDHVVGIRNPAGTWTVMTEVSRIVPTIACRAEGGLPAKLASEYRAVSVTVDTRQGPHETLG